MAYTSADEAVHLHHRSTSQHSSHLFFSDDPLDIIVEDSNRYAAQVMGDERYREWRKITNDEVKACFGFSILMGTDHLPSVDDNWSKDP